MSKYQNQSHLNSWRRLSTIESPRLLSMREKSRPDLCHGRPPSLEMSQLLSIGDQLTESTIFPGTRTSTFPYTADHAGLKEPPQHLLTDSIFSLMPQTLPPLDWMLRLWLTVKLVVIATVETHQESWNTLTRLVFPIPVANSTLLPTWLLKPVEPLISAETAHGLPLKLTTLVLKDAGLLTTRNTLYQTTTDFQVLIRWRLKLPLMDLFHAVWMLPMPSKPTPEESTQRRNDLPLSTTRSLWSDMELKMEQSTGLEETLGEPTGENKDSSECKCTPTTLPLKLIALPVSHHSPRPPRTRLPSSNELS